MIEGNLFSKSLFFKIDEREPERPVIALAVAPVRVPPDLCDSEARTRRESLVEEELIVPEALIGKAIDERQDRRERNGETADRQSGHDRISRTLGERRRSPGEGRHCTESLFIQHGIIIHRSLRGRGGVGIWTADRLLTLRRDSGRLVRMLRRAPTTSNQDRETSAENRGDAHHQARVRRGNRRGICEAEVAYSGLPAGCTRE